MTKLDKTSILYKEAKRIADSCKAQKRNLAPMDVSIIIARAVIGELASEGWLEDTDADDLLNSDAHKDFRLKLASTFKPLITASNNVQNGLMRDNELMDGNKASVTQEYAV